MNEVRHMMPVAAHLLLRNHMGEILFTRRVNTGYADGCWSVPAGHVERGETIVAACIRETAEEIAVDLDAGKLRCALVQQKHDLDDEERIDVFFYGDLSAGQHVQIGEPNKCDAIQWALPFDPPSPVVPYIAAALNSIIAEPMRVLSYFGFCNPSQSKSYHSEPIISSSD